MDQREYYFYTTRDPDEYWTEYGRSVEDVSMEELKEATLNYDNGLPNHIKHLEKEEQLALNRRKVEELIYSLTNVTAAKPIPKRDRFEDLLVNDD
jgi:hypothetical protein